MLLDKFQYLPGNAWVGTDVTIIHFPVAQLFHLCILGWHDANSDLRRLAQVRTVERNRRNWPTRQSLPSFLSQALKEPILHHHIAPQRPLRSRSVLPIRWDEGINPFANAISWRSSVQKTIIASYRAQALECSKEPRLDIR